MSWLTPSEIFTPHYGHAVASHILQEHKKAGGGDLRIYELGAGTGTLALDILDFLETVITDSQAFLHDVDRSVLLMLMRDM